MSESKQQFIPMTITECVRELSKLVPGAEIGFISAGSRVTWMRQSGSEDEGWSEEFTVRVGNRIRVTEKSLPEAYETAREYIWRSYGR